VKFGRTKNILDVLMKGAKFLDVGLIAGIYNSAKVWVAQTNINNLWEMN
jgi:hypothetical protein